MLIKKTGNVLTPIEIEQVVQEVNSIGFRTIRTNKKVSYINLEVSFDIETTSTYTADGTKFAFMYVWAMAFKNSNHVYIGRTWQQFTNLMEAFTKHFNLDESKRLVVYVHNLSYEFQYMKDYLEWGEVFAVDVRKPIKAVTTGGIEFRDSYILSGFSLARLASNLTKHEIRKLDGDLDYSLIRHSETELTVEELNYIENDVLIVIYYINEQMEIYGDITKLPMTNTGRVRSYVRSNCYYTNTNHRKSSRGKYERYRRIMTDLQLDSDVYKMLARAFMGGFTHANANYVAKVIPNVTSIDFSSSYPAVMLTEKFPMSIGIETKLTKEKDFNYYRKRFALLFNVRFTNIIAKIPQENYISESKCHNLEKPLINNGRIQKADSLTTTITDVDLDIIEQCYEWEQMEVSNVYRFFKGYLPKPIIDSVIKLYEDKTVLKDVEGSEVEYLLSKGMLNSVYGMCVTAIVRDSIEYDGIWKEEPADVEEQIQNYNESRNRFLYYPWGVWITAYARRNLWQGIIAMGEDYIYSDTDSIKFINYEKHKPFIEWYDQQVIAKLKAMCDHYKIDFKKLEPENKKGEKKLIGVWDLDGVYSRFKTLGAKRYLVEHADSGELELTVAGLSKRNGLNYMKMSCKGDNTKVFEMFNDELYIPADETGKMTHTYIDEAMEFTILDYQGKEGVASARSSVHLEKCDFTLSLARQYISFLEQLRKGYIYTGQKIV